MTRDSPNKADALDASADVIIVAFQSEDVVRDCVLSLRSDPAVDRIIVVNNSPGDGTGAIVNGIPGVTFLESPENLGFGRAINQVRDRVKNQWVALANPDTTQEHNTVSAAIDFLNAKPVAGLVGPRMMMPDGRLDRNSKHAMSLVRMVVEKVGGPERLQGSRSRAEHQRAHLTDYVIGSFVVCRRSALDAVDWFDESIFLFGEDQDLCRRIRSAGWEVWFAPIGKVVHRPGHSRRQLSDEGQAHFRVSRRRELLADSGWMAASIYPLLERLSGRLTRGRDRSR